MFLHTFKDILEWTNIEALQMKSVDLMQYANDDKEKTNLILV